MNQEIPMKLTAFAVALFSLASVQAAELSLYAIKSPVILNWATPSTLLNTTIRGAMTRASHQIGHVFIGFKCDGETENLSGMTNGKDLPRARISRSAATD